MATKEIETLIKLQIPAGQANPAPPVGPVLGQHGLNIMDFCNAFNEKTKELQGTLTPVVITVYKDRSFTFEIKSPPASTLIMKELKLKKGSQEPNKDKVATITIAQCKKIAEAKTKLSKLVNEKIDSSKTYTIDEAVSIIMEFKRESFVESVDVAYNLGVDPKHADQNIRLNLMLPHGAGKEVTVLALVNADKEKEAQDAGADFIGNKDYLEKIKGGWTDVDKIVVTPDLMAEIGKLGKILGPKGLMPNPKAGTVTNDVAKSVKELKAGKIDVRVEKDGILHSSIGKTSFSEDNLKENFKVFHNAVMSAKPNSFKGTFLNSISLSSSLGPGIKIGVE